LRTSAPGEDASIVAATAVTCHYRIVSGLACGIRQGRREWRRLKHALPGSGRWLAACAAAPLARCQQAGVLDPEGPIASAERLLMINATAIMLVVDRVSGTEALAFGLALVTTGVAGLVMVNAVAAALLAFTVFFYVVVYTMWLKRRTPQNIVIGGAAGALPPVIGWAAATGHVGSSRCCCS